MPGFVNCHCHVEYTSFRGILDDAAFADWIISLVDVKASLTPEEYCSALGWGPSRPSRREFTTIADASYGAARSRRSARSACAVA
jgi:5-methylthioadenosine/S-adenosylhomocysteine deaminase